MNAPTALYPPPAFVAPRRVLMGPGPSDVHPRVLAAMAQPTIGHLDPSFIGLMDDIKRLLQLSFRTQNELTMPVSGPGSTGMEACFANLLEPGDTIIVCENGVFGGRMRIMSERLGANVVTVKDAWGRAVDPQKVEDALKAHPEAKVLAFVQAETSTGALSDARTLAALARQYGVLSLVDAVTSLAGSPLEVDAWGIDAIYSGTQKCLSCPPGLSPVSFGPRAVDKLKSRKVPVRSWFMDFSLVMAYWGGGAKRAYHHTAPVNALYGLHEALTMLHEEGIEQSWARHAQHHASLAQGLEKLGLRYLNPPGERLAQLNAVHLPDGVAEDVLRRRLLDEHSIEIGAGLGEYAGKIWRIGLMGQSCSAAHVDRCLSAIAAVL
ncbi:MAG: pyridoxal-phosphate-dependent aminotransferase family protein [Panacagrimonas sp.]